MRKDVKAGLAISIVVIIASVWYFWGGSSPNEPIALENRDSAAPAVTLTARPQPTAVPRINRNADRTTARRTGAESSPNDQPGNRDRSAPRVATRQQPQPAAQPQVQTPPSTPEPQPVAMNSGPASVESGPAQAGAVAGGDPIGPTLDRAAADDAPQLASAQQPPTSEAELTADAVVPRPRSTAVGSPSATSGAAPNPGEGDAAVETYQVRKGDTLSQIAVIFYGSERYVEFLMKSNPKVVSASSIVEGMVLRIPALPEETMQAAAAQPRERAAGPASVPSPVSAPVPAPDTGKTYTVKEGDSFYAIALRTLGAGSRWPEIYELNKSVVGSDPAKLRPGTVLKLPIKDSSQGDQARSD